MGEWILIVVGAVFLYFCGYGIVHMLRLRRKGTIRTRLFEDTQTGLRFRHAAEWEILPSEDGGLEFLTHEHDGRGKIRIGAKEVFHPDPETVLRNSLREQGFTLDEPDFHPFAYKDWHGGYIESRAMRETERLYLQEWIVDGAGLRLHLSYRCSVLYGQIDAFDIDQLMRTLEMSPAQPE